MQNLLVRGAVAKVVARPGYGDLAGARSLTFNSDPFVFDRAEFGALPGWFGNGGNFNLKPFNAWQYDLGVEWYFHRGSVLGATRSEEHTSELQSLMRISYAVFCLKQKTLNIMCQVISL